MSESIPIPPPEAPAVPVAQPPADKAPIAVRLTAEALTRSLTTIATNAWKMQGRVIDGQTKEPREEIKKDEVKKMIRHIEAIFEALLALGIEVRDRTGEAFDYGLPDKIVASSPQSGLTKELIVETIRPTIYCQNQLLQTGEVVIATPIKENKNL